MKEIILDCDPGQDDALAILMALGAKNICLKGISVVGGNVSVDKCRTNALKVLCLANRLDIPVYIGATKPLQGSLHTLEDVFGECGMAGTEKWIIPQINSPTQNATDFLIDTYTNKLSYPHLCVTGPQTNIALALQKNKTLVKNIPDMTVMGGCVFPEYIHNRMGNISFDNGKSYAEYNFAIDPEAVHFVLNSGIQAINLIGLDITRKVLYNDVIDKKIRTIQSQQAYAIADMLSTVGNEDNEDYANIKKHPKDPVRAIHDAVAMAYLIDNTIFTSEIIPIQIDLKNCKGQTIQDSSSVPVNVIRSVNIDLFFELLIECLTNLKQ